MDPGVFMHEAILSVFLLMTAASAVPGPSDLLVISLALDGGFRRAVRVIPGIICADAVFILFASTGWMAVSRWLPEAAAQWLRAAGYLYLLWVCYGLFTRVPASAEPSSTRREQSAFLAGFFITLSDPTAIAFYAALLPMVTRGRPIGPPDALILFACAVCAISLVKITYALLAVRMGRLSTTNRHARTIRRVLAAIMAGLTLLFWVRELLR